MYIYLGGGAVVSGGEIVGIFDADNCSAAKTTRAFLRERERRRELTAVADGQPRYFVVTASPRGERTYFTQSKPRRSY
ncbi:MAG: DUF370 domain-containing protein [Oscillospiraceae bacterium]|jgi:hypothetical protein|nr:DUF370 domain-containing protein [Oscillospiraceae bacterium]